MTCTGGRLLFSMALCLSLLCSGCIAKTARFIQSDQSFRAQPATTAPEVFIDRAPQTAFASVGIVEVRGPVTASKEDFVNAAVAKGTELGCDLLIRRTNFEMRSGVLFRQANGVAASLFTCGVLDPAKPAQETARLADATAQEIVRSEYGDPFCPVEAPTGSHLLSSNCRAPGAYRVWNDGKLWMPNAPVALPPR